MLVSNKQSDGLKEGIARALSQAFTYGIDLQKTFLQVHGKSLNITNFLQVIQKGMIQSSLTSGIVYSSYFSVYNAMYPHPLASPIAALSSSVLKTPISNSMRVMQSNMNIDSFLHAGSKIHKKHGIGGLYSGYGISLAEDIIEMDLRIRFYEAVSSLLEPYIPPGPHRGLLIGALSGAAAAAATTPFDTLRAHLAVQATKSTRVSALQTTHKLVKTSGPKALFRGYEYRALGTGIKMALFYMFMGIL
jgi:hypothetical protein